MLTTYAEIEAWAQAVSKSGTTDAAKVAASQFEHDHQWDAAVGPGKESMCLLSGQRGLWRPIRLDPDPWPD